MLTGSLPCVYRHSVPSVPRLVSACCLGCCSAGALPPLGSLKRASELPSPSGVFSVLVLHALQVLRSPEA